ncbi:hypothetical protein FH593_21015 (plasmid) [Leptospira interrogans]|uniref:Uncharacterized protein n=3 Tax=Leptospira interrogans TaxID=173 RepID=A0A0E2DAK6_LEPIR|nr:MULTISPECIES: hypothetical protein [Leptospira]EMN30654.1 hypothetical protein LEP1GSC083_0022 [Leptospira interrogans serovar Pyrogenes str. L0374]EKR56972.1 hypothetical protein LEP1GSC105_0081 [Leptospira interrogans str. UI 12758]EMJ35407.1 hypothetical protein LEP1GSC079_5229 [Leptospira interrogans str. FPW1039]EMN35974.1 hypothetical protein LEP1GSC084_1633 [Leptospira interrogans serovar Medanensis str. L0448]EMN95922.1 hypothetical protein LEP1GSC110_0781 [Leptospira interrogans se
MAKSSRPNPKVLTGNDAIVKINGLTVGFMKSIRVSINNNQGRIQALGSRKPKGLKSLDWQGTATGEFHILTIPLEGVVKIDTYNDDHADDLYDILIIEKRSGKRVGMLTGGVNTEGFSILNNEMSGREIEFELVDWEPMEAFN